MIIKEAHDSKVGLGWLDSTWVGLTWVRIVWLGVAWVDLGRLQLT